LLRRFFRRDGQAAGRKTPICRGLFKNMQKSKKKCRMGFKNLQKKRKIKKNPLEK